MFSKSFFALALFAVAAIAQTTTETSTAADPTTSAPGGISACIIGCVQPAAQANGCVFTDASCVCRSAQFQADAAKCLQDQCTEADQQAALALQAQQCGAIGTSASGSATGTDIPASSSTGSGTTTPSATLISTSAKPSTTAPTGSAPPASTSNAAMGFGENLGLAGAIVAGVVGLVL
ncbi:ectomycorrhiza-regulated CFEM domain-containing protein [Lyophyllum atratum]|nr:ectomycorrhiza-regulated CFEM domain-containing protein [Lyophyllum atratum]